MRKLTLLILFGALALPVHAGLFSDDDARKAIEQLKSSTEARLQKVEAGVSAQIELANQLEALKQELKALNGQLEILRNDLEQAQKRQRDFYVDLDARARKLEGAVQTQAAAPQGNDPANETKDYETALNLLKAGSYKEAAASFQSFIKVYPSSSFQPSANFWAASALYQARDLNEAAKLFTRVVDNWPDDARAPDALLGLSSCQTELGDKKGARNSLQAIVSQYPSSPAAKTAKQRLGKK